MVVWFKFFTLQNCCFISSNYGVVKFEMSAVEYNIPSVFHGIVATVSAAIFLIDRICKPAKEAMSCEVG